MTATRTVITDMDIPGPLVKQVARASHGVFQVRKLDLKKGRQEDVEVVVVTHSNLLTKKFFEDFPNVKLIQSVSAGVDFIDFDSVPAQAVVCSNAGAYKEPIAEHVFGMILFFSKHLVRNNDRLRKGTFEVSTDGIFLAGKTLGILGAGGIGQSVARVGKAFNMKTIGINTSGKKRPHFDTMRTMKNLDEMLKLSDFVVISIPLNIHTLNLIDSKKLAIMKDDAILINVARGMIISQEDLYAHLKTHPNFKVGIDVWWKYPKKGEKFAQDFPFFELPNFLASPHNADGVPEAAAHGQQHAFENVIRYVSGDPVERVVDRNLYRGVRGVHP
jgi:phosphoglycerate dehydrogenase-like enzyme